MTKMNLCNFYIDDELKAKCVARLEEYIPDAKKGAFAALIRTLLYKFANEKNVDPKLIDAVKENYTFTTKKNKRSIL